MLIITPNNRFKLLQIELLVLLTMNLTGINNCNAENSDIIFLTDSVSNKSDALSWVNSYIELWKNRDITAIGNCLSDETLIITGACNKLNENSASASYKIQNNKNELLQCAKKSFSSKNTQVATDQIRIEQHKNSNSIFGINIHQTISTNVSSLNENDKLYCYSAWTYIIIDLDRPKGYQVVMSVVQSEKEHEIEGFLTLDDYNIKKND